MTRPVRITIDRLVLDGLPAETTPAAIDRAVRAALQERLAEWAPERAAAVPSVRVTGAGRSVAAAAGEVAAAVAGVAAVKR